MNERYSIRFDPVDPRTARGVVWEPIEIYIEPGKYNIASWFWENPEFTSPLVVNWAKDSAENQRALVREKIAEFAGCLVDDIINLESTS